VRELDEHGIKLGLDEVARQHRVAASALSPYGLSIPDGAKLLARAMELAAYYTAPLSWLREQWGVPGTEKDFRRRDLLTLLNNWQGELDRARKFVAWDAERREREARVRDGLGANYDTGGLPIINGSSDYAPPAEDAP
jgi:hypothetical protein